MEDPAREQLNDDSAEASVTNHGAMEIPADFTDSAEQPELTAEQQAQLDQASAPYLGKWTDLISTTNWDKGQIIAQWRTSLEATDAPATEYSDEAWSRRVGGITSQHVGRLRRVFQRFGDTHQKYAKLYWSHFQSAIDWEDAEMWLEGATQSGWSVAQMRNSRWETMGKLDSERPQDGDIISTELDEDVLPEHDSRPDSEELKGSFGEIESGPPTPEGPDFGDEDEQAGLARNTADYDDENPEGEERVKPFAEITGLPDDVMDAFDAFKLSIIRHRAAGWDEISEEDMIRCLDALKVLVKAPSGEPAKRTAPSKAAAVEPADPPTPLEVNGSDPAPF
ncbi:MAG: hypothetical protein WDZ51_06825 [Pirellulaceae bacterium]